MPDIFHDLHINAEPERVFDAVSTPTGLDKWWTKRSSGEARVEAVFELWFGPEWDWRARVTRIEPGAYFELEIEVADEDWEGTRVGFQIDRGNGSTLLRFHHTGWREVGAHFRRSNYCWAMYLRILKRSLELGDSVPYEDRTGA